MKKKTYKAPSIRVYGDLYALTAGSVGTCGDGTTLTDVNPGAPGSVTLSNGREITGCLVPS